jgi:cytochrome c biogenesis factor
VNLVAIIVQSIAIIIGGFWAYDKFGWDKKCGI